MISRRLFLAGAAGAFSSLILPGTARACRWGRRRCSCDCCGCGQSSYYQRYLATSACPIYQAGGGNGLYYYYCYACPGPGYCGADSSLPNLGGSTNCGTGCKDRITLSRYIRLGCGYPQRGSDKGEYNLIHLSDKNHDELLPAYIGENDDLQLNGDKNVTYKSKPFNLPTGQKHKNIRFFELKIPYGGDTYYDYIGQELDPRLDLPVTVEHAEFQGMTQSPGRKHSYIVSAKNRAGDLHYYTVHMRQDE